MYVYVCMFYVHSRACKCVCPYRRRSSVGALLFCSLTIPSRQDCHLLLRLELSQQPSKPAVCSCHLQPSTLGPSGMHTVAPSVKLGARDLSSSHACTTNIITHGDLSPGPEIFLKWPCKDQCSLLWGLSLKMCICLSAISFVNRHGKSHALSWNHLYHRILMNHIS